MFFEAQGYEVKSEICGCDVVAVKDNNPTVIIELKTKFSLELVLQGVDRLSVSNNIYLAILEGPRSGLNKRRNKIIKLCRILGFGFLLVTVSKNTISYVTPILEPVPNRSGIHKKIKTIIKRIYQSAWRPKYGRKRCHAIDDRIQTKCTSYCKWVRKRI
jgi:hypothetical protein